MNPPPYRRAVLAWMLVMLVGVGNIFAQRYTFRQYGSEQGLGNLSVNCLLQDRTGYIWAGTDNGLFRYDGSTFREYSHAEGLPSTEIRALTEGPDGSVWVATQGGVARSSGDRFNEIQTGEPGTVQNIGFDRRGRVYLQRASGVVEGIPDKGGYRFSTVAPGQVQGMTVHGTDVWFTRDNDFWHLHDGQVERIGSPAGLPSDEWVATVRDSLGNLWVRSSMQLFELPRGQSRFVDRSEGIPHSNSMRLYADPWGRLFVSSNNGVVVLFGANRTYIDPAHGLPGEAAGPVLKDREESLWIGFLGAGLVRRLGHGEWLSWKKEDGLLHNGVWSVLHDHNGMLWVGTTAGISVFGPDGKLAHTWNTHNGLPGDMSRSIVESSMGDVFVGTYPGGISRFSNDGRLLHNYVLTTSSGQQVVSMAIDREGRLWAVGSDGCYRSRAAIGTGLKLEFEHLDIPDMPAHASFRDIVVAEGGVVWISTSEGLLRYDGIEWRRFTEADGLKSRDISALADGQSAMYLSYRDALGITRMQLQGERVLLSHMTKRDGLSSDLIYAMALDPGGRLWVSTDNGVSVLEDGHWRHYGTEDGVIWDDGDDQALSIDRDGKVWIGTSGGLTRFAPLPYTIPAVPPPVVLTSIQDGAHEFHLGDHPALPHAESSLFIHFSELNFATEANARFRYRLLGYETDWHETRERSIRFASLPGGHYVFEVYAIAPNGTVSATPARFVFSVQRAWWQTWWFATLCMLAIGLLAKAIWDFRVRVLMSQKMELEREVAERTAELQQSHRQLEELAYCDMLTSLPNRRMFTEQFRTRVAMARRHGEAFALLLIDLDHFKAINDTYGHDAGDAVLVETARRLNAVVRETDCLARLGGDEFAILMITPDDKAAIAGFCGRIVESFEGGIEYKGTRLEVRCSVGIAMLSVKNDNQEHLYKAADLALYDAKRMGRSTYAFYKEPEIGATVELVVASDRQAS